MPGQRETERDVVGSVKTVVGWGRYRARDKKKWGWVEKDPVPQPRGGRRVPASWERSPGLVPRT